jgi:hypothetical protein
MAEITGLRIDANKKQRARRCGEPALNVFAI